ncbi:twin-arginine translocation signal domain-containing protein [Ancylobacter dichloromethanicus]
MTETSGKSTDARQDTGTSRRRFIATAAAAAASVTVAAPLCTRRPRSS